MTSAVSNMDNVELAATSAIYVEFFTFKIIIKEYCVLTCSTSHPKSHASSADTLQHSTVACMAQNKF